MTEALQSLIQRTKIVLEQAPYPSEAALRDILRERPPHIFHFVGRAHSHAANYGTIALLASDGRSRSISAQAVVDLVRTSPAIRLLILEALDEGSFCFEAIAAVAIRQNLAVAMIPMLDQNTRQIVLAKLYSGILNGRSADALTQELNRLSPSETSRAQVVATASDQSIIETIPAESAVNVSAQSGPEVFSGPDFREKLYQKRAIDAFDVFLCHNHCDKPSVIDIGHRLKAAGILPWLDVWELPPGQPWQPLLENQICNVGAAAVFVGSAGLGPWQEQELNGFLREFVERKVPVIPVLLQDAPIKPRLPVFLNGMVWVDFRSSDPDPLTQLIWGITGERPDI
jgi:hypothetical protein